MTGDSSRFLIVRLGSMGDVIHAIPAIAALRARYPRALIDWLVDPRHAPVAQLVEGVDHVIPLDSRGDVGTLFGTVRQLRRASYDVAIDLQGLFKSAVLARAARARRTIGFPRDRLREPLAVICYTDTFDPGRDAHVIRKNLGLMRALDVSDARVSFPLAVPRTAMADAVAERLGPKGYALINPGASWRNKRWPPDRFGAVAAELRERHGLRSLVLRGPGEEALASTVAGASRGAAEVSPPTNVEDLFALTKGAKLIVSGDTGPVHVAAAVGTPIVGLFGPTLAERNGPWSDADIALSRSAQCACLNRRRCRRAQPCIDDIGVSEVVAAVEQRLA